MADMETREDQKISECLQSAFGYSDEQLLKQLDQANEKFKDITFDGAEDRLMKRFMARKAELEKETAAAKPETSTQNESAETEKTEGEAELGDSKKKEKKVVRFNRKKKFLATAALVAVIGGMFGGTAIGEKNYFFRKAKSSTPTITINNDKNESRDSKLEQAYEEIEKESDIRLMKLGYYPVNLEFKEYQLYGDEVWLQFSYNGNKVMFYQINSDKSTSLNYESDRKNAGKIYNKYLNKQVEFSIMETENGQAEYEMLLMVNNSTYYLCGALPEIEFENIIKNLTF